MSPKLDRIAWPSLPFWGLLIAFAVLFFTGGSSRGDAQSLAILNPAMIICCGAALLTLRREHWEERKWLAGAIGIVCFLGVLYIIPWSEHLGSYSQGLGNAANIRAAADVSSDRQTLAIASHAALHSAFFLFAPLAVILFAVQLGRDDLQRALPLLLVLGSISGVVGVLQLAGGAFGPLYFYRITNNGAAVGLFANRNHAAVFLACLFPMLAVVASRRHAITRSFQNATHLISIAIAVIMVPLILVTGSRSGLVAAIIGIIGGFAMYSNNSWVRGKEARRQLFTLVWVLPVVICLVFATIYFSRAEAIDRFFVESGTSDIRGDFWLSSFDLFEKYSPFGFGPASFPAVYQFEEPMRLLSGNYLNMLHNDWLEIGLTFGIPGIILMLAGVVYYLRRSFVLWMRRDGALSAVALGRMASIIIAILGIASLSDYPLRTPAMAGFAALVLVWFTHARHEPKVYE